MPTNFLIAVVISVLIVVVFFFVLKSKSAQILVLTGLFVAGQVLLLNYSNSSIQEEIANRKLTRGTITKKERDPGVFKKYDPTYYIYVQFIDPFSGKEKELRSTDILKKQYEALQVSEQVDIYYSEGNDYVYYGDLPTPEARIWITVALVLITLAVGAFFFWRNRKQQAKPKLTQSETSP